MTGYQGASQSLGMLPYQSSMTSLSAEKPVHCSWSSDISLVMFVPFLLSLWQGMQFCFIFCTVLDGERVQKYMLYKETGKQLAVWKCLPG